MTPAHLGGHDGNTHMDAAVLDYLVARYGAKRLLDVGCGPGGVVKLARQRGLCATGIDGDPAVAAESVVTHDYTQGPLAWPEPVDLVWSVEFVEHVEEKFSENFRATFLAGRHLFLTHALPGQGGHHHVNERPPEYWIGLLRSDGWVLDTEATSDVKRIATDPCIRRAALVLQKALPPAVTVVVQTIPGREHLLARLRENLDRSDASGSYHVLYGDCGGVVDDPSAVSRLRGFGEHLPALLRWLGEQPTEYAIHLEDDAIVNEHLLHNVRSWPAVRRDDFGAGWLLNTWEQRRDEQTMDWNGIAYRCGDVWCSVGLLLRTDQCEEWAERFERLCSSGKGFDVYMSRAVRGARKLNYLHDPPIVEHDLGCGSSQRHDFLKPRTHDSGGTFSATWKRGRDAVPHYGGPGCVSSVAGQSPAPLQGGSGKWTRYYSNAKPRRR